MWDWTPRSYLDRRPRGGLSRRGDAGREDRIGTIRRDYLSSSAKREFRSGMRYDLGVAIELSSPRKDFRSAMLASGHNEVDRD